MKFRLTRSNFGSMEAYLRLLKTMGFRAEQNGTEEKSLIVDIGSLEELMSLSECLGYRLIVDWKGEAEIYDDFRENP